MKTILCFMLAFVLLPNAVQAYENDLDGLLKDYVAPVSVNGILYNGVDYDGWANDARHAKVRNAILTIKPRDLLSENEKLAYWINAYNVLTIDLIIRERERDSIKNLGSIFASPWKKHKWTIDEQDYSLDQIEHDTIRPMGDARIHFAVNCAAKSCPDLRREAYRANILDAQLDEQARLTFNNESKGFKQEEGNTIRITKVMDWFDEDFDNGDLNGWLETYLPSIVDADTNIKFIAYDWSLNKQ
jgi:hypothetical protein